MIVCCLTQFSELLFQLYRSQCTYLSFLGVLLTSTLHNVLSKPLASIVVDCMLINVIFNSRVFHDPLVSLNFAGFDPQIFLNNPQNLQFTFFISYEGGHCDPLNRKLRENPAIVIISVMSWPLDLSILSWSSFYQCSAQFSFKATGCFLAQPSQEQWTAVSEE